MRRTIAVAVVGYGNVGKAVVATLNNYPDLYPDMRLNGVFTRRPYQVKREVVHLRIQGLIHGADEIHHSLEKPDVAILCDGASALFEGRLTHQWIKVCNTVCSFDNHGEVPRYVTEVNTIARRAGHIAVTCAGWHPGTLSVEGLLANAFLGITPHHFYGIGPKGGLSMGHTQHVKDVPGVADGVQYTHAKQEAIDRIMTGENPKLLPGDMIWREVFVVLKPGADSAEVKQAIVSMEGYFAPYETKVEFVSQEKLDEIRGERGMAHDGMTIVVGETSPGKFARLIYRCEYDSNPEGTARILLACARAGVRLNNQLKPGLHGVLAQWLKPTGYQWKRGYVSGAVTMLDIPPALLSQHLRQTLLERFV